MNIRDLAKILNIIFAFASVPPSLYLVRILLKEQEVLDIEKKRLNRKLTYIFGGFGVMALINALVSLAGLLGFGVFAHGFSPIRGALIGLFFTASSWTLYLVQKDT